MAYQRQIAGVRCLKEPSRYSDVIPARCRIAARVIVNQKEARRVERVSATMMDQSEIKASAIDPRLIVSTESN